MSEETAKSILESQTKEAKSYREICKEMFTDSVTAYFISTGTSDVPVGTSKVTDPSYWRNGNESLSREQLEHLLARNKLINVAKYLNDGSLEKDTPSSYLYLNGKDGSIEIGSYFDLWNGNRIRFECDEFAEKAVSILGEDVVKLALKDQY